MYESINLEHSLYTIYLELTENQFISVGKLGAFSFQKGIYVYVGSAKRNIKQRIERHKKTNKKFHWHFDYLRAYGTITRIITYDDSFRECERAENIRKMNMERCLKKDLVLLIANAVLILFIWGIEKEVGSIKNMIEKDMELTIGLSHVLFYLINDYV